MVSTEEAIRAFIAESILFNVNGYPYPDDTSFLETGVVDSMGIMELVMFVEEEFQISIKDEEVIPDHFDSVSKISAYVHKKNGEK